MLFVNNLFKLFVLSIFSVAFMFADCPDGTDVCLSLDGGNLNYVSTDAIAGFQFDHNGCVTGASGGDATAAGFTVSASGTVVLGFSFTGSTIPAGSGTLIVLDGDVAEECLSEFIFSSAGGTPLVVAFSEVASGCTDDTACNYDSDAVEDDGSCIYDVDCAGECGGSAVVDDCGVCDGGNADMDCAGECNGDAVEDACSECGGTETNIDNCWDSNEIWIESYEDGSLDIYMSNLEAVAGFQFRLTSDITGFTLNGASGGSSSEFDVQVSQTGMVLGFAFGAPAIESGYGLLTSISVSFDVEPNGFVFLGEEVISDSSGNAIDFNVIDSFMIGTPPFVDAMFTASTGLITVSIDNTVEISGFQFNVSDNPDAIDVTSAYGGLAENAGFQISSTESGIILGFSMTGTTIPPGNGDLIYIDYTFDDTYTYVSLENVIFSNPLGQPIPYSVTDPILLGELPDIPDAPTGLTAELVEDINVNLEWDAVDNAEWYTVYRNDMPIENTTSTGYFDFELNYETIYSYEVTASNISGESLASGSVAVETGIEPYDPIPPSGLVTTRSVNVPPTSIPILTSYFLLHSRMCTVFLSC